MHTTEHSIKIYKIKRDFLQLAIVYVYTLKKIGFMKNLYSVQNPLSEKCA